MFSDILTPLPALGIEFDVVRGSGPIIEVPIRRSASSVGASVSTLPARSRIQSHVTSVYFEAASGDGTFDSTTPACSRMQSHVKNICLKAA